VDHKSGTAAETSLRGQEVIVPLTLMAEIFDLPGVEAPPDWPDLLEVALPLLRGLGETRNRGFGRVVATLEVH
jgi:hypothetical protein